MHKIKKFDWKAAGYAGENPRLLLIAHTCELSQMQRKMAAAAAPSLVVAVAHALGLLVVVGVALLVPRRLGLDDLEPEAAHLLSVQRVHRLVRRLDARVLRVTKAFT